MVPLADKKFDATGRLVDEGTREIIKELLVELVKWIKKLQ